jgi:hypothetical protein
MRRRQPNQIAPANPARPPCSFPNALGPAWLRSSLSRTLMRIYLNPRFIPELQNLTVEQRRGVNHRFFGTQYGGRVGLAGSAGFLVATALSPVLDLSFWPRSAVTVLMSFLAAIVYNHYALRRLRPEIASYVFVHGHR